MTRHSRECSVRVREAWYFQPCGQSPAPRFAARAGRAPSRIAKDSNVQAISKARPRWFEGVFVGHLELDDSAVVLADAEAITVRSFRRLPANDSAFLMRHVVCLGHLQANVPRSELKPVT